jgi:hypothetical protein
MRLGALVNLPVITKLNYGVSFQEKALKKIKQIIAGSYSEFPGIRARRFYRLHLVYPI